MTNLEQLDNGVVWRIPGGIHPPEQKHLSNQTAIGTLPLDEYYYVPVPQVGEQASMAVAVGDHVLKGQPLTHGLNQHHLPVHAPTSGVIKAIEPRPSNHASGLPVNTCVIQADGKDSWVDLQSASLETLSNDDIVSRVQAAGVAGMGGAAFPSHIKLSPASDIELVIINAVECEPYITSDDRLMREHADKILSGMEIIHQVLNPQRMIVGIEDNKPEAADALRNALSASKLPAGVARVTVVPTKYPSGGEKQLIQLLTGKEVPSGAIPAQLGILVHNVGTCAAISDAVLLGKPLIERVVTVTGGNVAQPGNYWMPIGTRVDHVLKCCGFNPEADQKVIIGGPMMGYTLPLIQVPVLKGTNCVLVPSSAEMSVDAKELSCIRCTECAQACPASLLPQQLYWHSKSGDYDKASDYNLRDCIECGCCSYVCPSDIPLVEYFRVAKSAIRNANEEKLKSERAKQRFEAKQSRLEEEKRQREAKAKEAAERRQSNMSGGEKDAIAAALARVQAKKATTAATPEAGADRKDKVADAVARAKARKAAQAAQSDSPVPEQNQANDAQKDKVAAAIARAKARKAAMQSDKEAEAGTSQTSGASADSQKDKVAAAIARAKAKKEALKQAQQAEPPSDSDNKSAYEAADSSEPKADDRQGKIAAAVARAKAKKAAAAAKDAGAHTPEDQRPEQASVDSMAQSDPGELSAEEAKKARVAAAVAKAKAKKAAQQAGESKSTVEDTQSEITEPKPEVELTAEEAKKARVAAAIAKAKAKKAAQQAGEGQGSDEHVQQQPADVNSAEPDLNSEPAEAKPKAEPSAEELKKARVAAAIAKAKAKKAAQQAGEVQRPDNAAPLNDETPEAISTGPDDTADKAVPQKPDSDQSEQAPAQSAEEIKKARIAAAIAKAKAKKAAKDAEDKE
nr:electron transport complex subunit RsxC [Shewanella submarina]